jgi:hypothetical protein
MKKKFVCFSIAAIMTLTMTSVAFAASFGGGNSYSKSLSYSSASTTTSLAGGYSGTATVSGTAYFYKPGNPSDVQSVPFYNSNSASAGGVNATASITHDSTHTTGYAANASHSGSATFSGGSPSYTYSDSSSL